MNTLYSRALWIIALTWTFLFFSAEGLRVVSADTPIFQSGPAPTLFLELYGEKQASENLPAQEWMKHLQNSGGLWKQFVPAVFYTDVSGQYAQRQKNYLKFFKIKSVSVPDFFVNGKEWKHWAENALIPAPSEKKCGVLKVENFGSGAFAASYVPPKTIPGQWLVHAALLDDNFSVLDYEQEQLLKINGAFRAPINLKSPKSISEKPRAVAVWVTRDNSLIPVQAAGEYLPQS